MSPTALLPPPRSVGTAAGRCLCWFSSFLFITLSTKCLVWLWTNPIYNAKSGTFNQVQQKEAIKRKEPKLKDKQVTQTPEHAAACQDESALTVTDRLCAWLFLDRQRNRKRVQSVLRVVVQRWGDGKGGCDLLCSGSAIAVRKWVTSDGVIFFFFLKWWQRQPPGWCRGCEVRVGSKQPHRLPSVSSLTWQQLFEHYTSSYRDGKELDVTTRWFSVQRK